MPLRRRPPPARREIHPRPRRGHDAPARRGAGAHRRDAPPAQPPGIRREGPRSIRPRAHSPARERRARRRRAQPLFAHDGRTGRHRPLRQRLRRGLDGPHGPGRLRGQGHHRRRGARALLLRPPGQPRPLARRRGGRAAARRLHGLHRAHRRLPRLARGLVQAPAPLGARRLAESRRHAPPARPPRPRRPAQAPGQRPAQPHAHSLRRRARPRRAHAGGRAAPRRGRRRALALLRPARGRAARAHPPLRPGKAPRRRALRCGAAPRPARAALRLPALGGLDEPLRNIYGALARPRLAQAAAAMADLGPGAAARGAGLHLPALAPARAGRGARGLLARARREDPRPRLGGGRALRFAAGGGLRPRAAPRRRQAPLPPGRVREDMALLRRELHRRPRLPPAGQRPVPAAHGRGGAHVADEHRPRDGELPRRRRPRPRGALSRPRAHRGHAFDLRAPGEVARAPLQLVRPYNALAARAALRLDGGQREPRRRAHGPRGGAH